MSASGLKIHLGCGKRHIRVLDMFQTGTADLIYACQVLEYFDRDEVSAVLAEWLSVPNFEVLARLYTAGLSLDYFLGTLYGKIPQDNGTSIYHRTTYDAASLKRVLAAADFVGVERWDWRTTEHAAVDDFSQAYFPHMDKERGMLFNLNMQAKKP